MATKLLALKSNEEHHVSLKERGFWEEVAAE